MKLLNKFFFPISLLLIIFLSLFSCTNSNDNNKIKINLPPEVLTSLNSENMLQYFLYFGDRQVDKTLTPNCGIATPGSSIGGVTTPGAAPTGGSTGSGTSKFTILSQLVIAQTGETMNLKFLYDTTQIQGNIDQQQGFTLTGGVFNSTITGRQGTVGWGQLGIGYVDESSATAQTLSFMTIKLDLIGFLTVGSTGTTTTPFECYTADGINCTTTITTSKCFTQDSAKCIAVNSTGTSITIKGTVKCNSQNVIPN